MHNLHLFDWKEKKEASVIFLHAQAASKKKCISSTPFSAIFLTIYSCRYRDLPSPHHAHSSAQGSIFGTRPEAAPPLVTVLAHRATPSIFFIINVRTSIYNCFPVILLVWKDNNKKNGVV
jgi:hypothetical protein